jgi:hypothetical protein
MGRDKDLPPFRGGLLVESVAQAVSVAAPVRATLFPASELPLFQNVNTPEEWAAHGS